MSRNMGKTQTSLGCGWKSAPKIRQHASWARVSNPRLKEGLNILLKAQRGLLWKMWTALAKSLPFPCAIL